MDLDVTGSCSSEHKVSVIFDKNTGIGEIAISGKLKVHENVDDPAIEIWNAVQRNMRENIFQITGKKLVNFTPLFPIYDKGKDQTIYKLIPSKPAGDNVDDFLDEAKVILDFFYKDLFISSFQKFLNDNNEIYNLNGYSLYSACIKRIEKEEDPEKLEKDIRTIRMLLENFIEFLDLPLPYSKEAYSRKAAESTKKIRCALKNGDLPLFLVKTDLSELLQEA